jgi:hypothetical protein
VLAAELAADGCPKQHFPMWFDGWAVEAALSAYAALGHDLDVIPNRGKSPVARSAGGHLPELRKG